MTTMRRIRSQRKWSKHPPIWDNRSHNTYCRQNDATSCGFFVGFYYECFLQTGGPGHFFKDNLTAEFMRASYRQRVVDVLHSIYVLEFPEYVELGDLFVPTAADRSLAALSPQPGTDNST